MKTVRLFVKVLATIFLSSAPHFLAAQEEDLFAFIPDGGRTLLEGAIANDLSSEQLSLITTCEKTSDEWIAYLEAKKQDELAFQVFDDWQTKTLAYYLSYNMPLDADTEAEMELPRDARDIVLQYCQYCHIITVTITQDRTREAWLGSLNKPSHIEIELTESERGALVDYLVLNAGIPIDLIPEELRAGGASY
jgi:hypothetical protein